MVAQYALGEVKMYYPRDNQCSQLSKPNVLLHPSSTLLFFFFLQQDHLLFTSIPLGNQITCQPSIKNRTLSTWVITERKEENKFIYIISSVRVEIVFSTYMYRNCQNQSDRDRKGCSYSKTTQKNTENLQFSFNVIKGYKSTSDMLKITLWLLWQYTH